jgi:plasmid stabilization system protein ParE
MAATISWSQESLDDIAGIAEYISRNSPYHAGRVVEAFFELSESIAEHPMAGRIVPELGREQVRERFVYSYRVLYEIGLTQIDMLAVIHGRQSLESIAERLAGAENRDL